MILRMQADALVKLGVVTPFRVRSKRPGVISKCGFGPVQLTLCACFFLGPGVVPDLETVPSQESPSVHPHAHQYLLPVSGKRLPAS